LILQIQNDVKQEDKKLDRDSFKGKLIRFSCPHVFDGEFYQKIGLVMSSKMKYSTNFEFDILVDGQITTFAFTVKELTLIFDILE